MANQIPFSAIKGFLIDGKGDQLGLFVPTDADLAAVIAVLQTGLEAKHLADGAIGAASIANGSLTLAKLANMATASLYYRKTAAAGAPEVNSLATLKTDLGLTGTNSGNQSFRFSGFAGADASIIPVSTVLAGALLGDKVAGVANVTDGTTVSADFETVISVAGHIQQLTADLSAKILTVLLNT